MDKYIKESLVRLKRQYSKDELVASLVKREKELLLEVGVLKSEKDELQYLLKKAKQKVKNKVHGNFNTTDVYRNHIKELKELKESLRVCKKENEKLICSLAVKNLELKNK